MSYFPLTEEQRMVRETARKFCQKEIEPLSKELEEGKVQVWSLIPKFLKEVQGTTDFKTIEELEQWARQRDFLTHILVSIELSKVCPSFALSLGASLELCAYNILLKGTREQKERYVLPLVRGEKIGCWGLTEPDAGSDIQSMKTRIEPDGEVYVVNGQKTFITNAPVADVFVIYGKSPKGFSAVILERGMKGLDTSAPMDKMGMRASPTGEIFMDNVVVRKANLLGEEGFALLDAFAVLNHERTVSPALMIGITERCLEEATRYAKTRVQFNRPIIKFQSVQFILARIWERLMASYAMLLTLGEMEKAGLDTTQFASATKLFTSETATMAGLDAIQVMGGYGYMREYKVERFMRDAKLMEIGAGTSQIQLLIMARKLMDDEPELNPLFYGKSPFRL